MFKNKKESNLQIRYSIILKKNDIRNWLFSDEKIFDLDGTCNAKNDLIWAINRQEAHKKGVEAKKT